MGQFYYAWLAHNAYTYSTMIYMGRMRQQLLRVHTFMHSWRVTLTEAFFALVMVVLMVGAPAMASTRFETRGLLMSSVVPGATTTYTLTLKFMSPPPVGSLDMLFCENPIPYMACDVPAGLDVSGATLTQQEGETGFSILSKSVNHIILTRTPSVPTYPTESSFVFTGMKNPLDTDKAFSIRLKSLSSTDGTGPQIDFGSVRGQVTNGVVIETQVPPMLIFCAAEEVGDDCSTTNETYYHDMGTLDSGSTLIAQSQMAVGTNATDGFVITANGPTMSAGINTVDPLMVPTESKPGTNQFGINLVENTVPAVGTNPIGTWANAVPAGDYGQTNKYKFVSGDVVAYSDHVSLMRKFTVSYILNSSKDIRAGVYSTTINYIASGRF